MPTPLKPDALTTVAMVKAYMRGKTHAADDTDLLPKLINSASKAIRNYTSREFQPKTPADDSDQPVARKFRYDGSGFLSLSPYELRTLGGTGFGGLGTIVLYSDLATSSQIVLTPQSASVESNYRLDPHQGTPEGTFLSLELPQFSLYPTASYFPNYTYSPQRDAYPYGREVTISGYWGVGTVPDDVEEACLMTVASRYRNPEGYAARQIGDLSFTDVAELPEDDRSGVPEKARWLLYPYRRKHIAVA